MNPQVKVLQRPDAFKVFLIPGVNYCTDLPGRQRNEHIVGQSREARSLKAITYSQLLQHLTSFKPNLLIWRDNPI